MEAIHATLNGVGAFFRRPYTNEVNFTYSHVTRTALIGMYGALIGLSGLQQKQKTEPFSETFEKLSGIKTAIVYEGNGIYPRRVEKYTNTTGFANSGETLVYTEEYLFHPKWELYIAQGTTDHKIFDTLKDRLLKQHGIYPTFLGKNHYPASFEDVSLIDVKRVEDSYRIDSLFLADQFNVEFTGDPEVKEFSYFEEMPYSYRPYINHYIERTIVWSNAMVTPKSVDYPVYFDERTERYLSFL